MSPKKSGPAARASAPKTRSTTGAADGRPAVKAALNVVAPEQRRLAKRLDEAILATVPGVVSAVKYRKPSQPLGVPFYGLPGRGWFVHLNALKGRVRLTFLAGGSLKPKPPLPSPGGSRAIDIASDDELDEKQLRSWLQQAAKLPGWGQV